MPRVRGGYIPSEHDGRDLEWSGNETYSSSIQLHRPPMRDQGTEIDCCTSMALSTAFEIVDHRDGSSTQLAPLYHYYYARRSPRSLGKVTMRQALRTACSHGFCQLGLHNLPSTVAGALTTPKPVAVADAAGRRLVAYDPNIGAAGYLRLDTGERIENWRNCLANGLPIVAGIWTQSSYWAGEGMHADSAEASRAAHAVCIVGSDDNSNVFFVRDSRGTGFANGGEWPLAYRVAASRRVIESWTIRTLTYND